MKFDKQMNEEMDMFVRVIHWDSRERPGSENSAYNT